MKAAQYKIVWLVIGFCLLSTTIICKDESFWRKAEPSENNQINKVTFNHNIQLKKPIVAQDDPNSKYKGIRLMLHDIYMQKLNITYRHPNLTGTDMCSTIDPNTGIAFRCSYEQVENHLECPCLKFTLLNGISIGLRYENVQVRVNGKTQNERFSIQMPRKGVMGNVDKGVDAVFYYIDKNQTGLPRLKTCIGCIYGAVSIKGCCERGYIFRKESNGMCESGTFITGLNPQSRYIVQLCDLMGSEYIRHGVNTAGYPLKVTIATDNETLDFQAIYPSGYRPHPCTLWHTEYKEISKSCIHPKGCTCSNGRFRLTERPNPRDHFILKDIESKILFSMPVTFLNTSLPPPRDDYYDEDADSYSYNIVSDDLTVGAIIGIVFGVVLIGGICSFVILLFVKRKFYDDFKYYLSRAKKRLSMQNKALDTVTIY